MAKHPRAYHRPDTLETALALLREPDTLPLAGGTKLLAADVTAAVVDLQNLGLNQIELVGDTLQIGATATLTDIAAALQQDRTENSPARLLLKAIQQAGPNTYRHAATVGGTIASRLPDSELLAALLVLEATVVWQSSHEPTIPVATYLAADSPAPHLITRIEIPWGTGIGRSERVARTPADYPIVSVTHWQPAGGSSRLAATGLGQRPFRLTEVEALLAGGGSVAAAAVAASNGCTHPGDFRGDSAYRAEMAGVLTNRVLASQ